MSLYSFKNRNIFMDEFYTNQGSKFIKNLYRWLVQKCLNRVRVISHCKIIHYLIHYSKEGASPMAQR